jgi:predicted metalloprotease
MGQIYMQVARWCRGRATAFVRRGSVAGAAAAVILALAACGSSSSTSSSTAAASSSSASSTAASATAVKADPHPIPGVASPAGAVPAAKAGLSKLHRVKRATGASAHLAGLGKLSLTQAVQEVSGDLNSFWSQEFASSGVQWPPMQDVIVDSSAVQTQCSGRATVAPTDPWYLCDGSGGGIFYWTIPWMQQNIDTDAGGVNLAFNMAEMWSFHILNLFGFTTQLQQGSEPKADWAEQAVCLTGVYVHSLSQRQLFEQGDQQTADNFVTSLSGVNGITSPDVTSQQLQQAFVAGFNSGAPGTCGVGSAGNGSGTATTTTTTTTTTTASPGTGTGPTTIPLPGATTG